MKKCPFCAEEILDEAIICKHCKSSLAPQEKTVTQPAEVKNSKITASEKDKKTLKIIKIVVLIIAGIYFWYLALPALALWYVWSRIATKKQKMIYSGIILVLSAFMWGGLINSSIENGKAPKLTITEPTNNQSVQVDNIMVSGKVTPAQSEITVNLGVVEKNTDGSFSYRAKLDNEQNLILIRAENNNQTDEISLVVNRVFTEEEKAQKQAAIEAKKKAEAERIAKEKAEQEAWDNSKAGKLCKKDSSWLPEDCIRLANNKIWIGMPYEMLKELRGLPDSANPSNYGNGIDWQWCWHDYNPSCFYDNNEDGLIDSFN